MIKLDSKRLRTSSLRIHAPFVGIVQTVRWHPCPRTICNLAASACSWHRRRGPPSASGRTAVAQPRLGGPHSVDVPHGNARLIQARHRCCSFSQNSCTTDYSVSPFRRSAPASLRSNYASLKMRSPVIDLTGIIILGIVAGSQIRPTTNPPSTRRGPVFPKSLFGFYMPRRRAHIHVRPRSGLLHRPLSPIGKTNELF
ncbi:hypothetical protein ES703_56542 [subsurface metagenome]